MISKTQIKISKTQIKFCQNSVQFVQNSDLTTYWGRAVSGGGCTKSKIGPAYKRSFLLEIGF